MAELAVAQRLVHRRAAALSRARRGRREPQACREPDRLAHGEGVAEGVLLPHEAHDAREGGGGARGPVDEHGACEQEGEEGPHGGTGGGEVDNAR